MACYSAIAGSQCTSAESLATEAISGLSVGFLREPRRCFRNARTSFPFSPTLRTPLSPLYYQGAVASRAAKIFRNARTSFRFLRLCELPSHLCVLSGRRLTRRITSPVWLRPRGRPVFSTAAGCRDESPHMSSVVEELSYKVSVGLPTPPRTQSAVGKPTPDRSKRPRRFIFYLDRPLHCPPPFTSRPRTSCQRI